MRRDWSAIAKETQQKVLEIVLKEGDVKKAVAYVQDIIQKLKDKKIYIPRIRDGRDGDEGEASRGARGGDSEGEKLFG